MNIALPLAYAQLEKLLNQALDHAPKNNQFWSPLSGKTLRVTLVGTPVDVLLIYREQDIALRAITPASDGEVRCDARLTGTLSQLARLAITSPSKNSATASSGAPKVTIEGNAAVVTNSRALWQLLEVDYEGWLAKVIGNIPAAMTAHATQYANAWRQNIQAHASQGVDNYLGEEIRVSSWYHAFQRCVKEVDELLASPALRDERSAALKSRLWAIIE